MQPNAYATFKLLISCQPMPKPQILDLNSADTQAHQQGSVSGRSESIAPTNSSLVETPPRSIFSLNSFFSRREDSVDTRLTHQTDTMNQLLLVPEIRMTASIIDDSSI